MAVSYDCGEGVTSYDSFRVSQRGAGANQSVDINMDQTAYVRGDAVTLQGTYPVPPHSATINETVTAADGTNPRIDRVVLQLQDNTHDASGQNRVQTQVLAGTPSGGATLDNLTGAAAVPSSAMLLADVLVPAGSSTVTNANIRDRRPYIDGVPTPFTDVEMVGFEPIAGMGISINELPPDNQQAAIAMRLPRGITGATRIRWKYVQGSTASTGNYAIGIYDASGRKIVDTGTVAYTGSLGTSQLRTETITATTFEPGIYYVLFGNDGNASPAPSTMGVAARLTLMTNVAMFVTSGGTTLPTTLLGLTDSAVGGFGTVTYVVPTVALSIG